MSGKITKSRNRSITPVLKKKVVKALTRGQRLQTLQVRPSLRLSKDSSGVGMSLSRSKTSLAQKVIGQQRQIKRVLSKPRAKPKNKPIDRRPPRRKPAKKARK